jgi:hypothetical protein
MQTIMTSATTPKAIRTGMEKLGVSGLAIQSYKQLDGHAHR